jgi:hypothetical protein
MTMAAVPPSLATILAWVVAWEVADTVTQELAFPLLAREHCDSGEKLLHRL